MHSIRVDLIALSSLIGFDGIAAYRSTSAKTTFIIALHHPQYG
jgi:uncharacterized membrane protein YtjA (UPF0391 family)